MTTEMDGLVDSADAVNGDGGAFANKASYYSSAAQSQVLPPTVQLANFIGLANLVYVNPLAPNKSTLLVNGTSYTVIDSTDDPSNSYQGLVLYDKSTNSVFVVDRGSQEAEDFVVDAKMAVSAVNAQWSDALALANSAAAYAQSVGASTVYTVGHSLGGTLAEMQAAYFGWVGYTFNAYGASDVFNQLGLTPSSRASINNYRTLFDVVSDASTHLGNEPVVIETPADVAFLSASVSSGPIDLVKTIAGDHSLKNFFTATSDTTASNTEAQGHVYVEANGFSAPASGQIVALAEDMVSGLALDLGSLISAVTTGNPDAIPIGDLSVSQAATQVWQSITNQAVSGIKAIVPSDGTLLTNALNSSTTNNIYRASLAMLSPVVLQGVDTSTLGNFGLWAPGQTTGLTKDYLTARNDMVQAEIAMAGQGQVNGGSVSSSDTNTYVYSDLRSSPSPMYVLNGKGGQTFDVVFAGDSGNAMTVTAGAYAELFGGAGDDTLFGGTVGSTLQGGAGQDDYVIDGTGTGTDYILDTDGSGEVEWKFADGSKVTLTGGDDQPGTAAWKSADGRVTYTEDLGADGNTELEIQAGNKIAYIEDFKNGELGITLNTGATAPEEDGNLSSLRDRGLAGNTNIPGDANYVYTDDIPGALVQSIYGADSSGSSYGNQINGEGNATYIYAGNGNNAALLGDFGQKATTPLVAPINAVLQGGSGNQSLIGVGNGAETITGGALGSDTTASTFIDGGGANALLVGGGQNSIIFGGTGADTLMASSATGSSSSGFNPWTVAMAGISFWGDAYSNQLDENNNSFQETALPKVNWTETSPDDVQINLSLYQSDGTFATPFGLLGSSLDSGADAGSAALPGSKLIGGTGDDWLIGNSGADTIIGGNPATTVPGVLGEVLVGGAGADLIYGGGGIEMIYADMTPSAASNWADLDPNHADTIYGGSGVDYIYGSGGDDEIYGGSGTSIIHVGNGNSYVDAGDGQASIYGGSGHDTIVADGQTASIQTGSGNAYVELSSGQTTVDTGTGSDTIEASGGSALVKEGGGQTTLIAGPSTGSDTIQPNSGTTVLELVDGLTESTLVTRDVNGDLVLSDTGFDTQITITGYFNQASGVSVQFEDGTTWGTTQILAASMAARTDGGSDTLVGSNGNDSITAGYGDTSIVATSGDNTLTGGAGDDTIQGGDGADTIEGGSGTTQIHGGTGLETYVFNQGDGSDTIFENATAAGADTLKFGAGISSSDLTYGYDPTSNALVLGFGASSSATLTVFGFNATQANQHQIETFGFADGTSLTQLQVFQKAVSIVGTTGSDSLTGTSGTDYFDGKGGNDTAVGGGGNDTFVFNAGYGQLTINEAYTGGQLPVLQLGTGITASALRVTTDQSNVLLTDGVSGDRVILAGMWSTSGDGVSAVQLADGTTLTAAQLLQMEMAGTTGSDTIYGTSGADLIDGDGGNDLEYGWGGSDTFVFNSGYGHLDINESYTSGQAPVLRLGAGITAAALQVTSDGVNLILTDNVSGDQVTLDGMLSTGGDGVAIVQLADGTSLTAAQLLQMEMTGTTASNTIYGTSGADLLDGKGGHDSEYGKGGSDTFVFNAGYGQLEIEESYTTGQSPVLQLGTGIAASALKVTTNGTNLIVTGGVSGDQITLDNMWSQSGQGVAAVHFADGTSLTAGQLMQMELTGTSGNDTIYGTSGADLIDGQGGSDYEIGQGGNDTFVFDAGYGHLAVNETYSSGQQPVLQLGSGISASMLKVTTDGTNLMLGDGASGDQVTLNGMWSSGSNGVAIVRLADGTSLTAAQLMQMEMTGSVGNDTIVGTSGSDLIDGKGGNDSVTGDGGADTFVFNAGYGQLSINENFSNGQQPVLQLGSGISASMLDVTTDGTNLTLTDGVSGDQITLDGMWASGNRGVAIVQFADGTSLTAAQLIQKGLTGTAGSDTLIGTPGADLIDGKGGDDYVNGEGGNDTIVFNAGYGKLSIYDVQSIFGSSPNQAVLELGPGISSSSLHVTENDHHDLILTDGVSGDQISILSPFERGYPSATAWGANVQFSDGSTLDMSQLQQMASNLNGTTGSDYLVGTAGADLIDGKGGNDYEIGNGGSDTFVFNQGYGALEVGTAYGYTLQLGAGITASNLQVFESQSGDGDDLMLTDGTAGDVIRLDGIYESNSSGSVRFSDGTTVALSQLVSEVRYFYTGVDTYRVGAGSGNQWLAYSSEESHIDIYYVDGLTSDDVAVRGNSAGYLTLTNKSTGSQFVLSGYFNGSQNVSIHFSDGVTWGGAQIIQAMETGGPGNDTITGTGAAERFDGKGGSDFINGGGGSDTFVFNSGYGQLEIDEAYTNGQQPVLQLGAGITASALQVKANGTDLVLTDGVTGDQITLDGQNASASNGVASVQFADGTSLTAAQLVEISQEIGGTTGNDTLTGTSGADWIDGKGGDDSVVGNGGSDTIVFNSGYGALEINEVYAQGQQPVLRLGAGISASALQVRANGTDLVLTDGVSGDRITLDGQAASGSDGVAMVQFADGTSLTAAQLTQLSKEIQGTTGNDTLTGTAGADLIDGKGGHDSVIGNGGSDTFVFNSGYGDLEINEVYTAGQQPVLQFGTGITASTLQVAMIGANAVLTDGVSGDRVTLDNQALSGNDGVALLQFADGSTWTAEQLIGMSHDFIGTTGNDLLTGNAGADSFDGLGGDDTVVGNGGNDTFVFNVGYGHLDINEDFSSGDTPVLKLGSGITAANLIVTSNASGSGLVLTDGTSGDQITLENAVFDDSAYGVQEVQLADGTTLTEAQLIQRETSLPGNGGSVTGGSGNDTLVADTANESLIGGTGNEVFSFNVGFGQDTLVANGTASSNTILFGAGITISNLTFSTDGSELVIATSNSTGADGKGSSITLPGHFVNGSPITDVGELQFSDGSSLSMDQINQLFASSTPPPPPPTTILTAGSDNTLVSDNGVDLLQANTSNDTLTGGTGTDTLESGVGNTLMNGGSGTETYLFNTGFGQDTVVANGAATSNTIQFGAGITVSDLSFSTDGSELDITDTNSNGADGQASSITLLNHFVNGSPVTDVGELLFSNGSYVTMDQINQLFASSTPPSGPTPSTVLTAGSDNTLVSDNGVDLLKANDGNDTLTGGSGTDTLESGVGNTVMNGGSGAETFLFNTGFGQDTVAASGAASSNTIQFGAGITVSDLNFMTDGSELLIEATNSSGSDGQLSSITLPDHWVDGTPVTDVGKLVFSDGSYVTMDQINQLFESSSASEAASTAAAPMAAMTTMTGTSAAALSAKGTGSTAGAEALTESAPEWSQSVAGSELATQVNLLTHAIATFTGSNSGSETVMPVTPATSGDLMLHAAA